MPLEPGAKLGAYEILASLGPEIYKAVDAEANRTVAIQAIPPEWSAASEFAARKQAYDRTAQAIAALHHPNIRTLYEIAQQDGGDLLVFEYLEGQTLAERLNGKPLNLAEALEIAMAVAGALLHAHAVGLVHRALTPAAILLFSKCQVLSHGVCCH